MKNRIGLFVLLAGLGLVACNANGIGGPDRPSLPVVDAVTPSRVLAGGTVTISGSNFGNDPAAVTVKLGSHTVEVLSLTPTSISVRVPTEIFGSFPVSVTVERRAVGPEIEVVRNVAGSYPVEASVRDRCDLLDPTEEESLVDDQSTPWTVSQDLDQVTISNGPATWRGVLVDNRDFESTIPGDGELELVLDLNFGPTGFNGSLTFRSTAPGADPTCDVLLFLNGTLP